MIVLCFTSQVEAGRSNEVGIITGHTGSGEEFVKQAGSCTYCDTVCLQLSATFHDEVDHNIGLVTADIVNTDVVVDITVVCQVDHDGG